MLPLYYLLIAFLIVTYFLIIPYFGITMIVFYQQNKIAKKFYPKIFTVVNLNLISKKNSWFFLLMKTAVYTLFLAFMIIITALVLTFSS
jgi:hypothetical protein